MGWGGRCGGHPTTFITSRRGTTRAEESKGSDGTVDFREGNAECQADVACGAARCPCGWGVGGVCGVCCCFAAGADADLVACEPDEQLVGDVRLQRGAERGDVRLHARRGREELRGGERVRR